jgi:hypothetical protein
MVCAPEKEKQKVTLRNITIPAQYISQPGHVSEQSLSIHLLWDWGGKPPGDLSAFCAAICQKMVKVFPANPRFNKTGRHRFNKLFNFIVLDASQNL